MIFQKFVVYLHKITEDMVVMQDCFDKEKHKEVFKDVKAGDTLYFLSFDGPTEVLSESNALFGGTWVRIEKEVSRVPSFKVTEHKVKEVVYPGLVPHSCKFLSKYGGVGTSTSMKTADWLVDFVLDNDEKMQLCADIGIGYKGLLVGDANYIFVTEEALKDTLRKYYEEVIAAAERRCEVFKEVIEKCRENLKSI